MINADFPTKLMPVVGEVELHLEVVMVVVGGVDTPIGGIMEAVFCIMYFFNLKEILYRIVFLYVIITFFRWRIWWRLSWRWWWLRRG